MKAGHASQTAEYVAMGRALAGARRTPKAFVDDTSIQLLGHTMREALQSQLEGRWPRSFREATHQVLAGLTAQMMGTRTLAIDLALHSMPLGTQVVLLGAGLDARAFRLPCLAQSTVFEVDHPTSQAVKRDRVRHLKPVARHVVWVPVDFRNDSLEQALAEAGHQPTLPTAWVLEGVVTYLPVATVMELLAQVARASQSPGRLVLTYNAPSFVRWVLSAVTAPMGEGHQSWFAPHAMNNVLRQAGFDVESDSDGLSRARQFGLSPSVVDYLWTQWHHVATVRTGTASRAHSR
jgi:methyltransferase (TIGR00027 family)